MKSTRLIAAVALLAPMTWAQIALPPPTAMPEPPAWNAGPQVGGEPLIQVTVAPWLTAGGSSFEASGLGQDGLIRSKLEWTGLDALMLLTKARVQVAPAVAIGGSYSAGKASDGKNTDTDFLNGPATHFDTVMTSRSESDTDDDISLYNVDLIVDLFRIAGMPEPAGQRFEAFVGYQHYQETLKDSGGVQTVINGRSVNEPFDNSGLNATTKAKWQAARIGLRGQTPVAPRLSIGGSAALLAFVNHHGEATWTLRDDLRQSGGPNIVNESNNGWGIDVDGNVAFALMPFLDLVGGVKWTAFSGGQGDTTLYYADGSTSRLTLDSVDANRLGVYLGLNGRF